MHRASICVIFCVFKFDSPWISLSILFGFASLAPGNFMIGAVAVEWAQRLWFKLMNQTKHVANFRHQYFDLHVLFTLVLGIYYIGSLDYIDECLTTEAMTIIIFPKYLNFNETEMRGMWLTYNVHHTCFLVAYKGTHVIVFIFVIY